MGDNARQGFETFFNWDASEPILDAAAGLLTRSTLESVSVDQGLPNLIAEFQGHAPYRAPGTSGAIRRFGQSALRVGMKAAWHGVPFLRIIMLNNPRFRRRAEEMREL